MATASTNLTHLSTPFNKNQLSTEVPQDKNLNISNNLITKQPSQTLTNVKQPNPLSITPHLFFNFHNGSNSDKEYGLTIFNFLGNSYPGVIALNIGPNSPSNQVSLIFNNKIANYLEQHKITNSLNIVIGGIIYQDNTISTHPHHLGGRKLDQLIQIINAIATHVSKQQIICMLSLELIEDTSTKENTHNENLDVNNGNIKNSYVTIEYIAKEINYAHNVTIIKPQTQVTDVLSELYSKKSISNIADILSQDNPKLTLLGFNQKQRLLDTFEQALKTTIHSYENIGHLVDLMIDFGEFGLGTEQIALCNIITTNNDYNLELRLFSYETIARTIEMLDTQQASLLIEKVLTRCPKEIDYKFRFLNKNRLQIFKNNICKNPHPIANYKYLALPTFNKLLPHHNGKYKMFDATKYPIDKLANSTFMELAKEASYIAWIDRYRMDRQFMIDIGEFCETGGDDYGPNLFDNENTDYCKNCIRAFNTIHNKPFSFENLVQANLIIRGIEFDKTFDIIYNFKKIINPPAMAYLYCGKKEEYAYSQWITQLRKSNALQHILSGTASFAFVDEDYQGISQTYTSIQQIQSIYNKHLWLYTVLIKHAVNTDEKIAVILWFSSIIECCHFFDNGNSRLSQVIFYKLMKDNNLPQSILLMPNGLSHYVINTLMFDWDQDYQPTPSDLATKLATGINWVKEGQNFYKSLKMRSSNNPIV